MVPIALSKLERHDVWDDWVWVARTLPHHTLLPALLHLRETGWADRPGPGITYGLELQQKLIDEAITAAQTA